MLGKDIFAILENDSVETMLRGAMEVECKPSSKHLADEIKNKDDLLTLGPFVEALVAGPTMSIIESLLVLGRLLARACTDKGYTALAEHLTTRSARSCQVTRAWEAFFLLATRVIP